MIKVTYEEKPVKIINACDMEPYDIGVIVGRCYEGHLVMRTAANDCYELMDLSDPIAGGWFSEHNSHKVRLLPPGTKITFEVI